MTTIEEIKDGDPQDASSSQSVAVDSMQQGTDDMADATLDAVDVAPWSDAALQSLGRFKIHLMSGDFSKHVSGKRKLASKCCVASVGNHHAHLLKSEYGLARLLKPGATVVAESAEFMVQLKPEHVGKFAQGAADWARDGGLVPVTSGPPVAGHMLFELPEPDYQRGG